ncbi:MAG: hypothetical protein K0U68_00615 [Gammaproteobacteria bacterium]|nr:hypothetical protein [Gammaproteobacteria bacterium]
MNKLYLFVMTVLSCAMVLVSCAEQKRDASLEDQLTMYEKAIRWADFDKASNYMKDQDAFDLSRFDGIKVTSYEPLGRDVSEDGMTVEENVRISYIFENEQIERTLVDHQVWEYDEEENRWQLVTSLPGFMETSQ